MRRTTMIGAVLTAALVALVAGDTWPAMAAEGSAPVVVGDLDSGSGAVTVRGTDGTLTALTPASLGLSAEGSFGTAVAEADLNRDGFTDIAVSAPQRTSDPSQDAGRVYVIFGAAGGYGTGPATLTLHPATTATEEFGFTLAAFRLRTADGGAGPVSELAVGAPWATVNGHEYAGAVYHYRFGTDSTATLVGRYTQNSSHVGGSAEKHDNWGFALAPGFGTVVVGAPDESLGSLKAAGAINVLTFSSAGRLTAGQLYSQDSPGVPGQAEAGDRFGTSLSFGGYAVGVPYERVGKVAQAGSINTFLPPAAGSTGLRAGKAYSQASAGIPGTAERADRFGSSLTYGWFGCADSPSVAVSSPWEDVGTIDRAGTVTLIPLRKSTCKARVLRQSVGGDDGGVPGVAEKADYLGYSLGTLSAPGTGARSDTLLLGVLGEHVSGENGYGRVVAFFPSGTKVWGPVSGNSISRVLASTVPDGLS